MNARSLAWALGASLVASGIPITASGILGYASAPGRGPLLLIFLGASYISTGLILYKSFYTRINYSEAVALTVAIWILTPVFGTLPFRALLGIPLLDSLFESVSAWTTTGLTIFSGEPSSSGGVYVPDVSSLPVEVKWLRTLVQWEGGLGIVIFTIAVLAPPGISVATLYLAEGKFERIEASLKRSAMLMGVIYVILTMVSVLLFILAGMPLVDAIHHAMTGVATAGFSTHTESLGYYHTTPILLAGMIVVMLGAISYNDHYNILRLRLSRLRDSIELQAQLVIILAASTLGAIMWMEDPRLHSSMRPIDVVFNIVSASATAGFQSIDLSVTTPSYKMLLAVLSLVGGSAFSTAGGIKVLRILVAWKSITIEASKATHPTGYIPRKRLGRYMVNEDLALKTLATIAAIIGTYTILVLSTIILDPGIRLEDATLEIASAMGNVGISSGITGAATLPSVKAILIAAMLLGRLEVLAYIVALKSILRH